MKKAIAIFCALLMLLTLTACGSSKPESSVSAFCEALKKLDFETMQKYTTNSFNTDTELEDLIKEEYPEYADLLKLVKESASKITYSITNSIVDDNNDDQATVTVEFKYYDYSPVILDAMSNYFSKAFAMAFGGASEEEIGQAFADSIKESYLSVSPDEATETINFECVKKEGGWLISNAPKELAIVMFGNIASALDGIF